MWHQGRYYLNPRQMLKQSLAFGFTVAIFYIGLTLLRYGLHLPLPLWLWLAALPVAASLPFIQRLASEIGDRWPYGKSYYPFLALENFLLETKSVTNLPELGQKLVNLIALTLHTRMACLFLPSDQGFTLAVSSIPLEFTASLNGDSPLAQWLKEGHPLTRGNLENRLQEFPHKERQLLEQLGAEFYIPLKLREELVAILAVGPKSSGDTYSHHDLSLLLMVAAQMAVTFYEARLFAQQQALVNELKRLNQLKTDVISEVAHELKTPLTAIKVGVGLLGEECARAPFALRLVTSLKRNVERLERLLNESVRLVQVKGSAIELRRERVSVLPLLEEAVVALNPLAKEKKQVLGFKVKESLLPISLDPVRFQEVLFNLLSNAIKFTPEGGYITMTVHCQEKHLTVEVEDEAPPIPPQELEALFQPYYRGAEARHLEGTGLGLAIARGLVELHGGRLWVSRGTRGNRFTFTLPLDAPERVEAG